jgi:hypothetical protein
MLLPSGNSLVAALAQGAMHFWMVDTYDRPDGRPFFY